MIRLVLGLWVRVKVMVRFRVMIRVRVGVIDSVRVMVSVRDSVRKEFSPAFTIDALIHHFIHLLIILSTKIILVCTLRILELFRSVSRMMMTLYVGM